MIDEILVRYFEGDASKDEIEKMKIWRAASPDNELEYQEFKQIWYATSDLNEIENLDIEGDLKLVKSRASKAVTPIRKLRFLRNIAAIMLPLLVFGMGMYFYMTNSETEGIYTLSDGTKVWLNGDSKLDFPKTFDGDVRKVVLSGEAFFDVAKNPNKPFIIETQSTNIEVLGTSFNVKDDENEISVVVSTGKVKFYERENPVEMVILTPGEKGVFKDDKISKLKNRNKNYASWHTGVFEFKNTPVKEVLQELSSYYGLIQLNKSINLDCLFKGVFEKESKESIIETLELSCGLK